jgi:hypothetical protein
MKIPFMYSMMILIVPSSLSKNASYLYKREAEKEGQKGNKEGD